MYRRWPQTLVCVGSLLSRGHSVWTSLPRSSQARSGNAGPLMYSGGTAFLRTQGKKMKSESSITECYVNLLSQIHLTISPAWQKSVSYIQSNHTMPSSELEGVFFCFLFLFFVFCLFKAAPMAYRGSQAKGQIGAVATSLCHGHSNVGSEPHLQPTP